MSSLFFITVCITENIKLYYLQILFASLFYFHQLACTFFLKVTSVGINTEWGMLMASISEDTGEETPLQVSYFILMFLSNFIVCMLC